MDAPLSSILLISSRNASRITAAKEARYAQITYKNLLRRNWTFTLQKTVKPLSIERGKYLNTASSVNFHITTMYFVFLIFFVLRFSLWWCDFQCWWTSVGHGLVPNSWYVGKRWLHFILIVYEPFSLSLTVSCHGLGEIIDFNFSWSSTVKFLK